jgi:hypothetical protein
MDIGQLRKAHMVTVTQLLDCFTALMTGDGSIDMREHGLTSDEECAALHEDRWPMLENADAEGDFFPAGAGARHSLSCSRVVVDVAAASADPEGHMVSSPCWLETRRSNRCCCMLVAGELQQWRRVPPRPLFLFLAGAATLLSCRDSALSRFCVCCAVPFLCSSSHQRVQNRQLCPLAQACVFARCMSRWFILECLRGDASRVFALRAGM